MLAPHSRPSSRQNLLARFARALLAIQNVLALFARALTSTCSLCSHIFIYFPGGKHRTFYYVISGGSMRWGFTPDSRDHTHFGTIVTIRPSTCTGTYRPDSVDNYQSLISSGCLQGVPYCLSRTYKHTHKHTSTHTHSHTHTHTHTLTHTHTRTHTHTLTLSHTHTHTHNTHAHTHTHTYTTHSKYIVYS